MAEIMYADVGGTFRHVQTLPFGFGDVLLAGRFTTEFVLEPVHQSGLRAAFGVGPRIHCHGDCRSGFARAWDPVANALRVTELTSDARQHVEGRLAEMNHPRPGRGAWQPQAVAGFINVY